MKKTLKRVLTLALAIMMIVPLMPVNVFASETYLWPSDTYTLSRGFSSSHKGIDINCAKGSPVYATMTGTVEIIYSGCTNYSALSTKKSCSASTCSNFNDSTKNSTTLSDGTIVYTCNWGYGNGIIIKNSDGTYSQYAHLSQINVSKGQTVSQGQQIGLSGSSGNSSGPHLHFALSTKTSTAGNFNNNPSNNSKVSSSWVGQTEYIYRNSSISTNSPAPTKFQDCVTFTKRQDDVVTANNVITYMKLNYLSTACGHAVEVGIDYSTDGVNWYTVDTDDSVRDDNKEYYPEGQFFTYDFNGHNVTLAPGTTYFYRYYAKSVAGSTNPDQIAHSTVYQFATSGTHPHSYTTYVYPEAAHPHYKCYQCSCGDVQRRTSETTFLETCASCIDSVRPAKANLNNFKTSYKENDRITFSWNISDSKATHYSLYIDKVENGTAVKYDYNYYMTSSGVSSVTKNLPVGSYEVRIIAYNSNYWEVDHSDWVHAAYDIIPFRVVEDRPITITLNANGGTLGTSKVYFYSGTSRFYSDSACTNEITKITVPTRAGYRFQYFYGDGTSGGENEEVYIYGYSADPEDAGAFAWDLSQDITKDAVLYAKWKPYVLTMNYNVNGGTINSSKYCVNDSLVYFTDGSKLLNDQWDYGTADLEYGLYDAATFGLTREGYTFVGWSLSADGSTTIYDQADNTVRSQTICPDLATGDRSVVFYAIWQSNECTLHIGGLLDGEAGDSTDGYGTFDVYVSGEKAANDVTSYSATLPSGTVYAIDDIRVASGKSFGGYNDQIGRTDVISRDTQRQLIFTTLPASFDEEPTAAGTFDGRTYYYFDRPSTWYEANAIAQLLGGHLATITSAEENSFAFSLFEKGGVWIGATDMEEEGEWSWINGEPFAFNGWKNGQPDNNHDGPEGRENYLHLFWNTPDYSDPYWNDNNGCIKYGFLVEIEPTVHEHNWSEPSYVWSDDNSTCTATRVCVDDASHVETETVNAASAVKTAATCEGKGTTTYTATFTNAAFTTQTKDVEDIAALGHDLTHHDGKAATCTEKGWRAYDTCANCDYTTYAEIPAAGHTPGNWIVDKEAGVGVAGSKHKECTVCHVVLETAVIPALNQLSYTITYNANNPSGGTYMVPGTETKNKGQAHTLRDLVPYRNDGYSFISWNTKADGSGTSYDPGATYTIDADLTLYAQWTVKTYTVKYDVNGGTGEFPDQIKTYGEPLTLATARPTRDGYSFIGWNTKADGTGTAYACGASYTANADVTLYAQWQKNEDPVVPPTPVDPDAPQIVAESKSVNRGKEFTVTVEIKNNPGVMAMTLIPEFSDKLTLVKAENGTLITDCTIGKNFFWSANDDVTDDGVLLTLTFTTADDLEPGDYNVGFRIWDSSNAEEETVAFTIVPGVITVTDITWGDANGDGVVNNKDIVRLKNFFANYDDITNTSTVEIFAGADANGDGVVNNKDIVRLKNYFANYDDVTNTSSVILGPAA